MFKFIVIVYCLVGLLLNLIVIPHNNIEVRKQNQFIIDRYKKLDKVLDKLNKKLEEE